MTHPHTAFTSDEVEQLKAVLKKHHKWHEDIGVVKLIYGGSIDDVQLDLSAEYADSSLCEETMAALALQPRVEASKDEVERVARAMKPYAKPTCLYHEEEGYPYAELPEWRLVEMAKAAIQAMTPRVPSSTGGDPQHTPPETI